MEPTCIQCTDIINTLLIIVDSYYMSILQYFLFSATYNYRSRARSSIQGHDVLYMVSLEDCINVRHKYDINRGDGQSKRWM